MSSSPLVSIIIPCFNAEAYIAEAIQSALDQTYPHTEVIVIDDGSTDGSLEVIKSFGSAIRWETGPNRGGCAARNRGIELAEGEFIQFLDSDDLLVPDKLQRHFDYGLNDDEITITEGQSIDIKTKQLISHFQWPHKDFRRLLVMLPLQTSAPLHRREALLCIGGFREELPCCQENDLHLRLAQTGLEFVQIPFIGYFQRRQSGSISSNVLKVYRTQLEVFWRIASSLEKHSPNHRQWVELFSEGLAGIGRRLWNLRDRKNSLIAFKRAREIGGGRIYLQSNSVGPRWKIQMMGWLAVWSSFLFRRFQVIGAFVQACLFYLFNHLVTRLPFYSWRVSWLRYLLGHRIGNRVALHNGLFVTGKQIIIGDNTVINRDCYLDGRGSLQIGANCSISPRVYILTATHDAQCPKFLPLLKQTTIEDYAWIGANATILPGVNIGKGSVVGAGSIVTKNVEQFTIVAGNPARKIGDRTTHLKYELNYFPLFDTDICLRH